MTTLSNPIPPSNAVNYEEPPKRSAPLLAVGPLAWIRNNLFSSWFDAILTVIASVVIVGALVSGIQWIVGQGNWLTINFNLRLFMIGRYEPGAEWRVQLIVLVIAFTLGISLAGFTRPSWRTGALAVVVTILAFLVPALINVFVPDPSSYFAAANMDIVSGNETQQAQPKLAFIARSGETLTVRLANGFSTGDEALRGLYGFGDNAANLLRGAAEIRLNNTARIKEIETQLQSDLLTEGQRQRLTTEKDKLDVGPVVTDTYKVNQAAVKVRILRGDKVLGEAELSAESPPLSIKLPDDGWYVLEKSIIGQDKSAALVQVTGIYPMIQRSILKDNETDASGAVTEVGGRTAQYIRVTDKFTTQDNRPTADGKDLPLASIIDVQYRGDHSFNDYLWIYLAPFLRDINVAVLLIVVLAFAGFGVGKFINTSFSPRGDSQRASRRVATYLLVALPVLMFMFIYGFLNILPLTDTRRWGGLLLTIMLSMVGIIFSLPLGIALALGRRSSLPVVSTASVLYIEFVRGVPFITVLFMAQLLVPLINPALANVDNVFRAMVGTVLFSAAYLAENVRGGLQSIPPGQEEAAKALGLNSFQIIIYITMPQALRAVIPALVGQFISLFIDTSLVAIVGLIDMTGVAQNVVAQTEFLGQRREALLFITIIYFTFSSVITAVSRRIEASGAGAAATRRI
jgi:His/Glu/Gln/Arg/opine family amino acid ABC transporter permease subunit